MDKLRFKLSTGDVLMVNCPPGKDGSEIIKSMVKGNWVTLGVDLKVTLNPAHIVFVEEVKE
jgi:hypothetical protein